MSTKLLLKPLAPIFLALYRACRLNRGGPDLGFPDTIVTFFCVTFLTYFLLFLDLLLTDLRLLSML